MSRVVPVPVLDLAALTAEVAGLLDHAPVAETTGAKLSRLLHAYLESDVLRLYADALERPGSATTPSRR